MKQRIDNFLGGTVRSELGYDEMSYTQNMYFESKTDGGVTRNILKGIEGMRMKYPLPQMMWQLQMMIEPLKKIEYLLELHYKPLQGMLMVIT